MRLARDEYWCDIFEDEVIYDGDQGPIDGQEDDNILQNPQTPAPSTNDSNSESELEQGSVTTGEPGNTMEESQLAALAESIHINPSAEMTTITTIEPIRERITNVENPIINQHTGHIEGVAQVNMEDEAALH